MANVFDYLRWRGDLSFECSPLCEIDALVFCELSYIFFEGIVSDTPSGSVIKLAEAADIFFERNAGKESIKLGELVPDEIVDLFKLAASTERFSSVELGHFVDIVDDDAVEQFSAISFFPSKERMFIAYRGTDDSIAGWREDFRMAFLAPVPSQKRAVDYLHEAASEFEGSILLGGHSKGGNLAMWAGLNATDDVGARIERIYNFDGPGFLDDIWESACNKQISDRISTVIPSGSVVGLLLKYDKNYRVVGSEEKKHLLQHNALTWNVLGCEFECEDDIASDVKKAHEHIGRWIYSMDIEARRGFVEGLFDIIASTNAKTLTALAEGHSDPIKLLSSIDPETKQAIITGVKYFVGEGYSAFLEQFKAYFKRKSDDSESPEDTRSSDDIGEADAERSVQAAASHRRTKRIKSEKCKLVCAVKRRLGLCRRIRRGGANYRTSI